jgi:drug/metabolite transporter (DMT)-like permease
VIALITPLMARRAPSPRIILAGIVVAAGAAFAKGVGAGGGSAAGILLAFGALAGEVSFALVAAPILADLGAWRVSSYACLLAVPLCLIGMVLTGEYALPSTEQLLALLWLGVVVTACAYVLWFTAVRSIGPERAGLFTAVVPISAVGVTALLGTGDPTWAHVAGAVIVLIGLVTGLVPGRTREPSEAGSPRAAVRSG